MTITEAARPTDRAGLSELEVEERRSSGRVNVQPVGPTRSLVQIIRSNVLTPVNGIMLLMFGVIVVAGHWRDGLFVGVVLSNSVVGIVQEVNARRELARLEVVNEPEAVVIRDGRRQHVDVEAVVIDDLVELEPGHQVLVDGLVLDSIGLEVDESLLTGESIAIHKLPGDEVRSGSFVVAGAGRYQATRVGDDNYASALAAEAKQFTLADSELRRGVDRVLRWLLAIIPVSSVMLLLSLLDSEDRWQDAVQGTVGAAVAMVPDGLVLLTSVAFVAGVIELSRHHALAKQLSSVEVLARVDVLCLDKTGTITTGDIELVEVEPVRGHSHAEVLGVLASVVAADPTPNATMRAIRSDAVLAEPVWPAQAIEPFSSERKWSAVAFDRGTFHLGAPEVLLPAGEKPPLALATSVAEGHRVLLLVGSPPGTDPSTVPSDGDVLAVVVLADTIRGDAEATVDYFRRQGVAMKIISGDHPATVATIAARAGVPDADAVVDARTLVDLDADELGAALESATVFGRVAPHQKQAMVAALQRLGHVVAMTGDGVNDVLALKQADLGVAMGSGSPASRAVADIVLTDDTFATLPVVVDEGRKVINNVERVANLFLTKAVYAVLLTVAVGLAGIPFPLLPRQLTLIGFFSIGVPGFFLAMSPEHQLVRPGFLRRVLRYSVPVGVAVSVATLFVYEVARRSRSVTLAEARTATTVTLLLIGLVVLAVVSRPLRPWKIVLVAAMATSYSVIVGTEFARGYFQLEVFPTWVWSAVLVAVVGAGTVAVLAPKLLDRVQPAPTTGAVP